MRPFRTAFGAFCMQAQIDTVRAGGCAVTFPIVGQQPPVESPDQVPPLGGSTYDGTVLTNSGVMRPGQSYTLTGDP